ncbi:hypothetical protein FRACYDRAFT_251207 [Fragilariopsis cylindrus CCMP1102]|uniref:Uncharacterized protein n=1 Tax=Fragilariopsis cylindrus CCMP1102 TaxID=635003 RepID=A0A1E7EPC6_9STRA|nr:hypothetical protein FRACYDRAFT_251207 [Fragilariopsis cylindrus CCMP1102]|eukprot:OEU07403.1 hypothetical protein FRACYDRAFT_251207 [Fragilariopsis cylindrus CCMP1102]
MVTHRKNQLITTSTNSGSRSLSGRSKSSSGSSISKPIVPVVVPVTLLTAAQQQQQKLKFTQYLGLGCFLFLLLYLRYINDFYMNINEYEYQYQTPTTTATEDQINQNQNHILDLHSNDNDNDNNNNNNDKAKQQQQRIKVLGQQKQQQQQQEKKKSTELYAFHHHSEEGAAADAGNSRHRHHDRFQKNLKGGSNLKSRKEIRERERRNKQTQQQRYQQRHSYNNNNNNNNSNKKKKKKLILFVHFHKAGGTTIVNKFRVDGGYKCWRPNANGNPKSQSNNVLQFWNYNRTQFTNFLLDGASQSQSSESRMMKNNTNKEKGGDSDGGVEFLAMEWNFLQQDHFFQLDINYLQIDANMELITILRSVYPIEVNVKNKMGGTHIRIGNKPTIQYGKVITNVDFHLNHNKPNYYVSYLNGFAQNGDDSGDEKENDNYSFDYFAFGLNRTHLNIAKQRLRDMFDVILILERPDTYQQLYKYFEFIKLSGSDNNNNTNNSAAGDGDGEDDPIYALPKNNEKYDYDKEDKMLRQKNTKLLYTREEFYKYNALDKELYEYAIELSLSKTTSTSTTTSQQ